MKIDISEEKTVGIEIDKSKEDMILKVTVSILSAAVGAISAVMYGRDAYKGIKEIRNKHNAV